MWMILILLLTACAPISNSSWTRAEVASIPSAQQAALDKDRAECVVEGNAKGIYYQAIMGSLDVTACLERRGWKRVP